MLDPDKFGFVLWEGLNLLFVIFGGIGILVLRRVFSGRPAFTHQDWQLFFGPSKAMRSTLQSLINFGAAVLVCLLAFVLDGLIVGRFGPAVFTVVFLFSSLGVVKHLLF